MAENQHVWPGWETTRKIGTGGFGAVYEIRREIFGNVEYKAMKVITIPKDRGEIEYMRCEGMDDRSISHSMEMRARKLLQEYTIMSQFRENPNIVQSDDVQVRQRGNALIWDVYIRMELLTPLMDAMDQVRTEEQIIRLAKDMCNALIDCEKAKVIHRDIKPQNVFLSPRGNFKLGDFGISRTMEHTTNATAIGTYAFIAPEVANHEKYGSTVDIYSLGLMLYWLLNERRGPFLPLPPAPLSNEQNAQAWARRLRGDKIPAPRHGSSRLQKIVLKACAFKPKNRYQTAQEMLKDLNALADVRETEGFFKKRTKNQQEGIDSKKQTKTSVQRGGDTVIDRNLREKQKSEKSGGRKSSNGKVLGIVAAMAVLAVVLLAVGVMGAKSGTPAQEGSRTVRTPAVVAGPDAWKNNVLMKNPYADLPDVENVYNAVFLDSVAYAPGNAADVSEARNGSVLAWIEDNTLYTAGEGGVNAGNACFGLFQNMRALQSVNMQGNLHMDQTKSMANMFFGCKKLRSVQFGDVDTSQVAIMTGMFQDCGDLITLDLSMLDTGRVTNMILMFAGCDSLRNLDLSGFDMSGVQRGNYMFSGCNSLESNGIKGIDQLVFYPYFIDTNFMDEGKMIGGLPWAEFVEGRKFEFGSRADIPDKAVSCAENGVTHFYYVYQVDNLMSWEMAERLCESKLGHLATPTTYLQNKTAYSAIDQKTFDSCVYFGLSDDRSEGTWEWVTGEKLSTTYWHSGEPNGGSGENYGCYYPGFSGAVWNDGDFAQEANRWIICEWDVETKSLGGSAAPAGSAAPVPIPVKIWEETTSQDKETFIKTVNGQWGAQVTLNNSSTWAYELNRKLENCREFSLDFHYENTDGGVPEGDFVIYIRPLEDSADWTRIGSFSMDGSNEVSLTIELAKVHSFDALAILPPNSVNQEYRMGLSVHDVWLSEG